MRSDRHSRAAWGLVAAGVLIGGGAGCAGSAKPTPMGRPLSLSDFVDASRADMAVVDDAGPSPASPVTPDSPGPPGPPGLPITEIDDEPRPIETPMPPAPAAPRAAQRRPGPDAAPGGEAPLVIVDSLVGQVNGRPIYASEFFEPIEDRLIAEAGRSTQLSFRNKAASIIFEALQQRVINELVLAEAQAGISVEQQQGLLNWLTQRQISQGGGTRAGAESRILKQEGISVEEFVGDQMDQALVVELLRERVERNVIVTWRDIEREYRRRSAEFHPPPEVVLSKIRVSLRTQSDKVDEVKRRLAAGEPFAEVGAFVGPREGVEWQRFELGEGGLDDVIGDEFKGKLELEIGHVSEPVQLGSSLWWLEVTDIVQAEGRPLFHPDVQRELAMEIRARRRAEEQGRFIGELMEGGIMDELTLMADRLIAIAIIRYAQ